MAGIQILLVDDEPALLTLLKRHLERTGYSVVACHSGEAALETLDGDAWQPDLLITDEVLPGMSGSMLASGLLARFPRLLGLLCSGYEISLDALPPPLRERVSILQKPYAPPALERAVQQLLERRVQAL